jgi:4-amino-4-deoxy-L-arabinose transferase-like glycosyltransferase
MNPALSYSPLLGLVYLVLLVLFTGGVGAALTRRIGGWQGRTERAVFAVPLGMGVVGLGMLVVGLLRLLHPALLKGILFGGALVGAGLLAVSVRRAARETAPAGGKRDLLGLVAGLAFGVLGLCTLLGALAPPGGAEWDALSYHLADPKVYLREGRILFLPYEHHSNFPFQLQMLYLLMLGAGSVAGAKLVHWLCGVLLVASVYTFARRHVAPAETGRRVGLIAALLVAATPIALWEASVAYADLATALFTWLSLYALFNAAQPTLTPQPPLSQANEGEQEKGRAGWLVLSAVLMGFGIGTKMTGLGFWGMALVGLLAWHRVTTGRWSRQTIPHALLWAGVSLAVAAPWYVKTYLYTGNPVYPFYYNLFGGRYWNAENAAMYAAEQAKLGMGKTPLLLLLGPWNATAPATAAKFNEYGFTFVPATLALFLAAPLVGRRYSRASVGLALFAVGGYVFWFYLMQQARYFLPVLPAVAVVGAEALAGLWDRRGGAAKWLGAALTAASVGWGAYFAAQVVAAPAVKVVTGAETVDAYAASHPLMSGTYPAEKWINENAPPDAKVALFNEVFGFYLDREYLWATPNHAADLIPWESYATVDDWLADFKRRGYTYLLVNERNAPIPGQRWPSLLGEAITGDKVTAEFNEKGVSVYRIR